MSIAEESASRVKLAKLVAAFDENLEGKCIEAILQMEGDVNYALPFNEHLESINHKLQPGTVLHQVRRFGDDQIPKILNLLLHHGVEIVKKNSVGQTVLHAEVLQHCKDNFDHPIIKEVLSAHVNHSIRVNPRDGNGITHFHVACMSKHTRAVQFFLDNGVEIDQVINLNSPIFPGCSPLHIAVNRRCLESITKLLDYGANVYSKNAEGLTVLHVLTKRNLEIANCKSSEDLVQEYKVNQKMIHLLLTSGNVNNKNNNNNNNNNKTRIITDERGFSNLHAACTIVDVSLAKSLLTYVKDVNKTVAVDSPFCPGYTALHFAAHFSIDLVKLLLAKGGNVLAKDAKGITPLDVCLQRYSIDGISHIILNNSVWNIIKDVMLSDNCTSLAEVIFAMQCETMYRSFLHRVKNVNCFVDKNCTLWSGYTILHFAVLFSERAQAETYVALRSNGNSNRKEEEWPNLTMVRRCVARGADFTAPDSRGTTPLHLAFYAQKENILSIFLDNGHKMVNPIDENNVSHLHIACAKGMFGTVQNLVSSGADVNLATRLPVTFSKRIRNTVCTLLVAAGSTPLHMAVADGNLEVAKYLLQHGADLNAINVEGWSPVHLVMLLSSPEKIGKALFAFSAKLRERVVENVGLSHLHVACRVDSLRGVKKLLKLGSSVNAAVKCDVGNGNYIGHYCESKCDLICKNSYAGFTPLHFAVHRSSIKIINFLLEAGADVLARNAKGMSPLWEVLATNEKSKYFDLFVSQFHSSEDLRKRVQEDSGMTLLHIFAFKMDVKGVEESINGGVDINASIQSDSPVWPGCTALHMWVYGTMEREYTEESVKNTLKLLLDGGADVTLANAILDTPVHSFNYSQITIDDEDTLSIGRLLLRSQTDFGVNVTNASGVSHFHIAVRMCDVVIAQEFLKCGVDVNQRIDDFSSDDHHVEKAGFTPLHLLTYGQSKYLEELPARVETIDLLLKHGADVCVRDVLGNTPLHALAKTEFMREELVEKIIRAGGAVEAANLAGETPFAVLLKSARVSPRDMELFLQHGCRVNVYNPVDGTGILALPANSYFKSKRQANAIYKLLYKNPDIKSIDDAGRTSIHNAVSSRGKKYNSYYAREIYTQVIERLVKLGCDIDAQDQTGKTALHMAAQFKNNAAIFALLMSGADINVVDKNSKSPFEYGLEVCDRCKDRKDSHYHVDVIDTILTHVQALQFMRLTVTQDNKTLVKKALKKCANDAWRAEHFRAQLEKTKQVNIADSLRLYDLLSETGGVAAYPTMSRLKRRAIVKFFTTKNKILESFSELRGFLRLQYKKLMKRAVLIENANDSLRVLCGIALPQLCCEHLLRFLSFSDIQSMIASVKN